jgi:peptide/nickel transport system permease protein
MTDRLRSEMSRTPDLNARGIDFGPAARSESYLRMVARQFMHHRAAVLGMAVIVLFFLTALLAPYIAPYDPAAIDLANRLQGPSAGHWLGTDELGRDVFSRIIIGARITLIITMGAVGLALFTGTVFGLIAGFYGGPTDTLISRSIDVLMAMPGFLLAIGIIAALGVGTLNVILAVGIASIPDFARIARSSTLSVRSQDYILSARSLGAANRRIISRHIGPNIVPPLIVAATMRLATAILSAASLSFLGLGPQPPTPEWGAMLSTARDFFTSAPLLIVFPGLAILLVTLSFNLMGDGLRDALNPHLRR